MITRVYKTITHTGYQYVYYDFGKSFHWVPAIDHDFFFLDNTKDIFKQRNSNNNT